LSPVQLREEKCVSRILGILKKTGLDPARLQLEITESVILDTDVKIRNNLKALRKAGVKVVLDDFGTGYSSLTHLQTFDVDKVKIDKSYIQDISRNHYAAVHAITGLAHVLGIAVTAEGVETDAQRTILQSIGCTELQGYLFSQPLSSEDAARFLARRPKLVCAA